MITQPADILRQLYEKGGDKNKRLLENFIGNLNKQGVMVLAKNKINRVVKFYM